MAVTKIPASLVLERPETTTSQAARLIAEAIIRGEFQPGASLPEVPLAKRLEISRGTVREALREVESLGLIEILAHKGAFVRVPSTQRLQEVISLRAVLESFASRLAMEVGNHEELVETLTAALDRQRQASASGDVFRIVNTDLEFHKLLSFHSEHELLLEHLDSLAAETRRFVTLVQQHMQNYDELVDYHVPILEAVKSGNPDDVARVVFEHVTNSGQRLIQRLEVLFPGKSTFSV